MKYLTVKLWGEELGRLVWNLAAGQTYFQFAPDKSDRPDVSPLLSPTGSGRDLLPIYGETLPLYQDLPAFIADSLPDAWGNELFDK